MWPLHFRPEQANSAVAAGNCRNVTLTVYFHLKEENEGAIISLNPILLAFNCSPPLCAAFVFLSLVLPGSAEMFSVCFVERSSTKLERLQVKERKIKRRGLTQCWSGEQFPSIQSV